MKILGLILLVVISINAKVVDVDIQAEYFESDKNKNIVIFRGNVSMVKADDTLVCQEIILKTKLNTDTNKTEIISYVATGDVSFTLKSGASYLIGNGQKVIYDLEKELYIIKGDGYIEDKLNNKMIRGENIYINQKTGQTKIDGTKNKPVKFKFTINSKN